MNILIAFSALTFSQNVQVDVARLDGFQVHDSSVSKEIGRENPDLVLANLASISKQWMEHSLYRNRFAKSVVETDSANSRFTLSSDLYLPLEKPSDLNPWTASVNGNPFLYGSVALKDKVSGKTFKKDIVVKVSDCRWVIRTKFPRQVDYSDVLTDAVKVGIDKGVSQLKQMWQASNKATNHLSKGRPFEDTGEFFTMTHPVQSVKL